MRSFSLGFFALAILVSVFASTTFAEEAFKLGDVKNLARYTPRPEYPFEARARRWVGSGIGFIEVDPKSGSVMSARMERSTGYKILDDSALGAFKRWRFNPEGINHVFDVTRRKFGARTDKLKVRIP